MDDDYFDQGSPPIDDYDQPAESDDQVAQPDDQQTESPDQAYQDVLAEIEKQRSQQKSWVKNLVILAVSLLIFFQLGLFRGGLSSVLMIIVVLLVHETGHLLGMRLFGYRNVQMFFIPFFGAAVSGESRNVATYKKAIISLLGPLPGILIGCVVLFRFAATGREIYFTLAAMFLFINCFNLLPFFPLDGGRFLYLVIFSRNRYLEFCFRLFAALALILVGYALGAWLLALLGLFNLWAVKHPLRLAKIAGQVRNTPECSDSLDTADTANVDDEVVPAPIARVIIDRVYEHFPPPIELGTVAGYTKEIWERVCFRPSGILSTVGLLFVYFFVFCLPLAAFIGSLIVSVVERRGFVQTELVRYDKPDGSQGLKEQIRFGTTLSAEIEVDPQTNLYHGTDIQYADANAVLCEGNWSQGKHDGSWTTYDDQGDIMRVTIYDNGAFVSRKEKINGQWVDKEWEDLPFIVKWRIRRYQKKPRGPTNKGQ
jgi:Zn-dependent protease